MVCSLILLYLMMSCYDIMWIEVDSRRSLSLAIILLHITITMYIVIHNCSLIDFNRGLNHRLEPVKVQHHMKRYVL